MANLITSVICNAGKIASSPSAFRNDGVRVLFYAFLLVGSLSAADEFPSNLPLLGHNLTPTSYTIPEGHFTPGTFAVAYGITGDWSIGTSPWIIAAYNMPMIESKFGFRTDTFFQHASLDLNYFRTFEYGFNFYKQESTFVRLTGSHRFSETYTLHISAGHQYFFDDTKPYSLRLIPGNGSRTNLSLSTLNEFHLFAKGLGVFAEVGLMGLNYSVPWLHTGLSAFYYRNWGLFQLGVSRTVSLGRVPYYVNAGPVTVAYWHPEIQIQFFL